MNRIGMRIIFDEKNIISTKGQMEGDVKDREEVNGELKYLDIPYYEHGISNLQIVDGEVSYTINEKPLDFEELYRLEVMKDLMEEGLI